MSLKSLNEAFHNKYKDVKVNKPLVESFSNDLRASLDDAAMQLSMKGDMNLKSYEIAFQDAIEKAAPDKSWWEVTNLNIFWDLFENRDVAGCINRIIDNLNPEYKDEVEESLDDAPIVNESTNSYEYKGKVIVNDDKNGHWFIKGESGEFASDKEAEEYIDSLDESLKEDIKIYKESDLTDFEFWSGAKDTVKYLTDEDLRQICNILEDSYPEGLTETEVNDIFWFEDDWIAEMLGYGSFEELMEERDDSVDEDLLVRGKDGKLTTTSDSGRWGNSKEWNWNNESLTKKLKECLRRLREGTISPEDKEDSDHIRSMLAKMQNRSNARFSPEEQAVLDKYGISRNNYSRNLQVGDADLDNRDVDGKQAGWTRDRETGDIRYKRNNGDKSKINYADRARKLPQRVDNQVTGRRGSGYATNSEINSHTRGYYSDTTLQTAERGRQERDMAKPMVDMSYALGRRNSAKKRIANADAESQARRAKARKEYEDKLATDARWYKMDTVDATKERDTYQSQIDNMLKRDKKEGLNESPSYEMSPQYDARKSFYGKARVDDEGGVKTLYSYNTPVARISNGNVELLDLWDSSQTTLRHVKEFLRQNGFEATSLAQIRKTYM